MEEDKNKIFVNAMVNFGYMKSDVNVALARSLGNEEVNIGMATITGYESRVSLVFPLPDFPFLVFLS